MIVNWDIRHETDRCRMYCRTQFDADKGDTNTYSVVHANSTTYRIVTDRDTGHWTLEDVNTDEVVHEFRTNNSEVVVSILNLLYDTR